MSGHKEPRGKLDGKPRWRLRVHLGTRDDGSRATASETFVGSARAADARLAELVAEHRTRNVKGETTFTELVADWLEVVAPSLGRRTRTGYIGNLRNHVLPRFGTTKLSRITVVELERLYRELEESGRSPATVHQVHSAISTVLTTAVRWGWIPTNPAHATKRAKIEWRPPRVTDTTGAEVARIFAAIDEPEFRAAVIVAAGTGMRRGELCGLRWSDVDLARGAVHIERAIVTERKHVYVKDTKNHQDRTIALDAGTLEVLVGHWASMAARALEHGLEIGPGAYVFSDHPAGATPWKPDRITWGWRTARAHAGVSGLRFHDLRHYHVTRLLELGTDLAAARDRAGHREIATTGKYAHGLRASDRRAATAFGAHLHELGIL